MILYLFVYYLKDILWWQTLHVVKKLQSIFWNKSKVSKQQTRTFGSTRVRTSFIPNTKVGHHLLVLQNFAICVEGAYNNLARTFLFFPLKYKNRPDLTNL
jgi:hypothetical protein